jgi:hypothetical protein
MSFNKHTRRLSRREAVQVLSQAYDHQQQAKRGSTNSATEVLAISLKADVWEQVVYALRPITAEQGFGIHLKPAPGSARAS